MAVVLVVDDDVEMRAVIMRALTAAGHDVAEATDGAKGLEQVASRRFDLIITDIIMPDMEGIEFILHIRRALPNLKVLAISGGGRLASEECYLRLARSSGATRILAKPFVIDALLETVNELLADATTSDEPDNSDSKPSLS